MFYDLGGGIFVYKSLNGEYVYYYILELDDITKALFHLLFNFKKIVTSV